MVSLDRITAALLLVLALACSRYSHDFSFPFAHSTAIASDLHNRDSSSGDVRSVLSCCASAGFDVAALKSKTHYPESLIKCLQSAEKSLEKAITTRLSTDGGPSLTIGIVTFASRPIWNYSLYSFGVNLAYSEKNNYIFKYIYEGNYEKSDERWNKIKILEDALDVNSGWARSFDFVMWIDADLIFLDFAFRLESIASENPEGHVFISAEHSGSSTRVNSGSILVRNSGWTRRFLRDWWGFANRTLFSDQEQLDMLYEHRRQSDQSILKRLIILSPDAINSDPPAMTRQASTSRVLHLMGEDDRFRKVAFKSAFREVCKGSKVTSTIRGAAGELVRGRSAKPITCRNDSIDTVETQLRHSIETISNLIKSNITGESIAVTSPTGIEHVAEAICTVTRIDDLIPPLASFDIDWSAIPHQLSLTQSRLHLLTILEYGRMSHTSVSEGRLLSASGCMGLRETRELSNRCHHLAHALWNLPAERGGNSDGEDIGELGTSNVHQMLSWSIREEVFRIMYLNILRRRTIYNNRFKNDIDSNDIGSTSKCSLLGRPLDPWTHWPEHLKLVAEAGQHLMSGGPSASSTDPSELSKRDDVAAMVTMILFEILDICHVKQQDAVRLMISHTFMDRSLIALDHYKSYINEPPNSALDLSSEDLYDVQSGDGSSYSQGQLVLYLLRETLLTCNMLSFNNPLTSSVDIMISNYRNRTYYGRSLNSKDAMIPEEFYFYNYYLNSLLNNRGLFSHKEETTSLAFALIALQTSIRVAKTMGSHILTSPLSHLGALLASKHCQLESLAFFSTAFKVAPASNKPALLPLMANFINALRETHYTFSSSRNPFNRDRLRAAIEMISGPSALSNNDSYLLELSYEIEREMKSVIENVSTNDLNHHEYSSYLQKLKY